MAHFAEIDKENKVVRVLVTDNGMPNEGHQWLVDNLGGRWIKTSYNAKIRKNFAGVDFTYDQERDAFIPPKPFESWLLDEETCDWVAPEPHPSDGNTYRWDESTSSWQLVDFS